MITLSETDVNNVLNYLQDQPAKIANPLISFFNTKINEYNQSIQQKEKAVDQGAVNEMKVVRPETLSAPKKPTGKNVKKNA